MRMHYYGWGRVTVLLLSIKLKMLLAKAIHSQILKNLFTPIRSYTSNILSSALKGAMDIEQLPEKFKDINYSDNKKLKQILSKGTEVNQLVDSNETLWHVLLEGRTKRELVIYQRILREIVFKNKTWESIQKIRNIFGHCAKGATGS